MNAVKSTKFGWFQHQADIEETGRTEFILYRRVRETSWSSCDWRLARSGDVLRSSLTMKLHFLCYWRRQPSTWTSCVCRWRKSSASCCRHSPETNKVNYVDDCINSQRTNSMPATSFPPYFYFHWMWRDLMTLKHGYALHCLLRKLSQSVCRCVCVCVCVCVDTAKGHRLPTCDTFDANKLREVVTLTFDRMNFKSCQTIGQ